MVTSREHLHDKQEYLFNLITSKFDLTWKNPYDHRPKDLIEQELMNIIKQHVSSDWR